VGNYEHPAYGKVSVSLSKSRLVLKWYGLKVFLQSKGKGLFAIEDSTYLKKFGEARNWADVQFEKNSFKWKLESKLEPLVFSLKP